MPRNLDGCVERCSILPQYPEDIQEAIRPSRGLPSPATPHLRQATRTAGLRGRNLEFIESRVIRRLKQAGLPADRILTQRELPGHRQGWPLPEDHALTLALLFRVLAPMRSRDNLRAVVEGIEQMGREEASYWLGMTLHRVRYRRVCAALRLLFTAPTPPKPQS